MFERLTDRLKHALKEARQLVQRQELDRLTPEHVLLGMLEIEDCTANRALAMLAVDAASLRTDVEASLALRRPRTQRSATVPLSLETKRLLQLALSESLALKHRHIGTEHALLAMLGDGIGGVTAMLARHGVDAKRLRAVACELAEPAETRHTTSKTSDGDELLLTNDAKEALSRASAEASRSRHDEIDTDHLLCAIVVLARGPVAGVLMRVGIVAENVRAAYLVEGPRPTTLDRLKLPFSKSLDAALVLARHASVELGRDRVGLEHLLLGLLREAHGTAQRIVRALSIDPRDLEGELLLALESPDARWKPLPRKGRAALDAQFDPVLFDRLTGRAKAAMTLGGEEAADLAHAKLLPEHVLVGLTLSGAGVASVLAAHGVDARVVRVHLERGDRPEGPTSRELGVDIEVRVALERAAFGADRDQPERRDRTARIGVKHLALALLDEPEGLLPWLLVEGGVDLARARDAIRAITTLD